MGFSWEDFQWMKIPRLRKIKFWLLKHRIGSIQMLLETLIEKLEERKRRTSEH